MVAQHNKVRIFLGLIVLGVCAPLIAFAQYGSGSYGSGSFGVTDTTPPTVSMSAPANGASVVGASISVSANASDDFEVVGVQFTLDGADLGVEDTVSPYAISWNTLAVSDGSHTLAAVARDPAGNTTVASSITVTVDNTAPVRSSGAPSGTLDAGTDSTTVSLSTDENATCRYAAVSGVAFNSMSVFDTTGARSHSLSISGLSDSTSYSYFVKCQDALGNTNGTNFLISFTVASDTTSPTVSIVEPENNSVVSGSLTVEASAYDDDSIAGVQIRVGNSNLGDEDTESPYGVIWNTSIMSDGAYLLTAVARDSAGNISTSSSIAITVDNTAPVRGGATTATLPAGTTQTNLTFATDEDATCRYKTNSGVAYGSMDTITSTGGTAHSLLADNLSNNSSYTYFFRCSDGQGNANVDDYPVSFSVAAATVSSGGGGGGGGGSSRTSRSRIPTIGTAAPIGVRTTVNDRVPSTPVVTNSASGGVLLRNLSTGSVGDDVKTLQTFLIAQGFLTVSNGPTPLFGPLTTAAIQKYQCARSIVCAGSPGTTGFGAVGPQTRARLNSEIGGVVVTPGTGGGLSAFGFSRTLQVGSVGSDVQRLQSFLIQKGYLIIATPTTYFGALTRAALQKYQCEKQIACSGTPATTEYGSVGTRTLAALNTDSVGMTFTSAPAPVAAPTHAPATASNTEVVALQKFLINQGLLKITTPTGTMGPQTKAALGNFQFKYGLIFSASDPSYGVLDAKTKAKIEALSGN